VFDVIVLAGGPAEVAALTPPRPAPCTRRRAGLADNYDLGAGLVDGDGPAQPCGAGPITRTLATLLRSDGAGMSCAAVWEFGNGRPAEHPATPERMAIGDHATQAEPIAGQSGLTERLCSMRQSATGATCWLSLDVALAAP
jgi:hypothetical protein